MEEEEDDGDGIVTPSALAGAGRSATTPPKERQLRMWFLLNRKNAKWSRESQESARGNSKARKIQERQKRPQGRRYSYPRLSSEGQKLQLRIRAEEDLEVGLQRLEETTQNHNHYPQK